MRLLCTLWPELYGMSQSTPTSNSVRSGRQCSGTHVLGTVWAVLVKTVNNRQEPTTVTRLQPVTHGAVPCRISHGSVRFYTVWPVLSLLSNCTECVRNRWAHGVPRGVRLSVYHGVYHGGVRCRCTEWSRPWCTVRVCSGLVS